MSKTVPMLLKFDPSVAKLLRKTIKRPHTLSGFVQDAVVKALRRYRAPEEQFIEDTGKRSLDRVDGVPWLHSSYWPVKGWEDYWAMNASMRSVIDEMREQDGREPISDAEWLEVINEMGREPGWKRPKIDQ